MAHFLAYSLREYLTVVPIFSDECWYVLEALREVYRFDAEAKE